LPEDRAYFTAAKISCPCIRENSPRVAERLALTAAVASYKHGPTIINAFLRGERAAASIPRWGEVQAYLGKVFDGDARWFDTYK